MEQVKILGAKVDCPEMVETLCLLSEYIRLGGLHHVLTLNAEILYNAQSNPRLLELINKADLVTPDGSGVVWAIKKMTGIETVRVTGIDLMQEICRNAPKNEWGLFLFGAAPGVADAAAVNIAEQYGAKICGTANGFFDEAKDREILAQINEAKPDILFVALGAPKQEEWIDKHRGELSVPVVIGVGGSFDVIAGNVKRAPKVFQKLGLEWLWRLIRQPSRIGRMTALPKFTLLVNKRLRERNHAAEQQHKPHKDKKLP